MFGLAKHQLYVICNRFFSMIQTAPGAILLLLYMKPSPAGRI
jgi:hypothetical protein